MNSSIRIRLPHAEDEKIWRQMWADYNAFYGAVVPEATTAANWDRILDPSSLMGVFFAVDDSGVIGFANYVLHSYTWSESFACLIDDLFVKSEARSRGAGRLLIQHIIDQGKEQGWTRVYWMTREGNTEARALYDQFCLADGFVRYSLALDGIRPSAGDS